MPNTYMTTPANSPVQAVANGKVTVANPAEPVSITLGFRPRYIRVVSSAGAVAEYFENMASGEVFNSKDTAGTTGFALASTNGFTVDDTGFVLSASNQAVVAGATLYWIAIG